MKIVIAGLGKIGETITSVLVEEGHDITAIDIDQRVLTQMTNVYDIMGVCGNCADSNVLEEADIQNTGRIIATPDSDELNMLTCFIAKKMGARHSIARVRAPEYNDKSLGLMKQHLNISVMINPELLAAHELYNILQMPSATNIETFSARNFEMIEYILKPDSVFVGMKLADMRSKFKAKFLIGAVKRGDEAYIPDGNFVLQSGDRIGLTAENSEILKLLREMGIQQTRIKKVLILGASRTAYYLAKRLTASGTDVTVIEQDRKRCEEFGEDIPKATVINGNGTDRELLMEEGLHSTDGFISLTGIDEGNILFASYAASEGVPKVIPKVNNESLVPLAERWGIDTTVSPKKLVADVVLKYVRALHNSQDSSMETLYKLMDDKVEALEFYVKSDMPFLHKNLKDLALKPNILIAGIIRDRKIIIPSGDDYLAENDRVVVLAAERRINKLSDIMKQR